MNQEDVRKLARRLGSGEPPREIPGSDECRNRLKVVVHATNESETESWEEIVDGVLVGTERLMLIWRWERRLGIGGEESPADKIVLPYGSEGLVQIQPGVFRLKSDQSFRRVRTEATSA